MRKNLLDLLNKYDIKKLLISYQTLKQNFSEDPSEQNLELLALAMFYILRVYAIQEDVKNVEIFSIEMIQMIKRNLKKFPRNFELLFILGNAYGLLANFQRFIPLKIIYGKLSGKFNQRAIQINPTFNLAVLWRAGHYLNAPFLFGGNKIKAIHLLNEYCIKDPCDEWAQCMLSEAYYQTRNFIKSEQIINSILKKNSSNLRAKNLLEKLNKIKK